MHWQWYSTRPEELFIDMDRFTSSINHVRRRLQGAIECGSLDVREVHLYPSITKDHAHMIVVLRKYMPSAMRFAWEMLLHGDIYRAASNIMRLENGVMNPDILISARRLHRAPDAECYCESKHKIAIMETCPAAITLRGSARTKTFFGKPSNNDCSFLPRYRVTQILEQK